MATHFSNATLPPSVAALPFLFARPQVDDRGWDFRAALAAAVAAERANNERRNTRGRLSYLLCELGFQLRRRGGDCDASMPLSRAEIAEALGVSLCRVKRTLALLGLSQVIVSDGAGLRVVDWPRMCGLSGYDPKRLDKNAREEEFEAALIEDEASPTVTVSGDPACFV